MIPGEWSNYFIDHFSPFLNIRMKTEEQRQALKNLMEYCDETTIRVPRIMKLGVRLAGGIKNETRSADEMISYYRDMSKETYEALKEGVLKGAKLKSGILKYHHPTWHSVECKKNFKIKGIMIFLYQILKCYRHCMQNIKMQWIK